LVAQALPAGGGTHGRRLIRRRGSISAADAEPLLRSAAP
jgi:hypothetical protein